MIAAARTAGLVFLTLAFAGCADGQSDAPLTADRAARAACRQQAEQSYNIRNRADLYRPDYGRDAPMSGQSSPEITRGLSERYSFEQSYQDCLRSRGARLTPPLTPTAPKPAPPASARPPAPMPAPVGSPAGSSSDLSRPPTLTP